MRRSLDGEMTIYRENAGTNGLLFDRQGRLLICQPVMITGLHGGHISICMQFLMCNLSQISRKSQYKVQPASPICQNTTLILGNGILKVEIPRFQQNRIHRIFIMKLKEFMM